MGRHTTTVILDECYYNSTTAHSSGAAKRSDGMRVSVICCAMHTVQVGLSVRKEAFFSRSQETVPIRACQGNYSVTCHFGTVEYWTALYCTVLYYAGQSKLIQ